MVSYNGGWDDTRRDTRDGGKREMERDISYAFGSLLSFSFFLHGMKKTRDEKPFQGDLCFIIRD